MKKLLIYGATGYTGRLITQELSLNMYEVIIAGRDEKKLKHMSEYFKCDYKVFNLYNAEVIHDLIHEIDIVLNVAGPFIADIDNLIEACIENRTHFIDLAMDPRELAKFDMQAKQCDVMLLSGAGHAFLPLDCLGGFLHGKMPNAKNLSIYISGMNTMSRGTAKSNIALIKQGIHHRINGSESRIRNLKIKKVKFNNKEKPFVPSAFGVPILSYSTGVANIESYFESTPAVKPFIFIIKYLSWLFKFNFIQKLFEKKMNELPEGPTLEERDAGNVEYLAKIKDVDGNELCATLLTPEAYKTTYLTTAAVLKNINKNFKPGFQTPYRLFGAGILNEINGFKMNLCEVS